MEQELRKSPSLEVTQLMSPVELLRPVWRRKNLVIVITLLTTFLFVSSYFAFAKYRSQGFFQFGGVIPIISVEEKRANAEKAKENKEANKEVEIEPSLGIELSNFKRYAAAYSTYERFAEYLKSKTPTENVDLEGLRRVFSSPEGFSKVAEPIFPFTKSDAKDLMEQPKGVSSNNIIALKIAYEAASPEVAINTVRLLGDYLIDTIIYIIYFDALTSKHDELTMKLKSLENEMITNRIKLQDNENRIAALEQIVVKNPRVAADQNSRQVVNVTEDTARYLPPMTQLMTAQVLVSDLNSNILKIKREMLQNELLLAYFDRVKMELKSAGSGETMLKKLEALKDEVFRGKDLSDDIIKETYNTITIDNQNALTTYLNKSRFVAGPTMPAKPTLPLSLFIALGLVVGLVLSVIVVLLFERVRPLNR